MKPTLPAPLLQPLSERIAARFGLHFPAERWSDLQRGIAAAAAARGQPDVAAFARQLLAEPLAAADAAALAASLTIGETYFCREKASLDALERHILPRLIAARADGPRRLRLWSAGCCTGEEAYTLAILLDRLLPDASQWEVTLLATDLNPVFLRRAAHGEYGEWSFRETPDWVRERYFRQLRNGRYRMDERIRRRVRFACLNLAADDFPSPASGTEAMDVILCRNVLMYFAPEQARAVIGRFRRALGDCGWLIVSPAETSGILYAGFAQRQIDGALLYEKVGAGEAAIDTPIDAPIAWVPPAPEPMLAWQAEIFAPPAAPPPVQAPLPQESLPSAPATSASAEALRRLLQSARDCADRGQLAEAAEQCRQAIAAHRLDPASHYLLGTILEAQGQAEEAAQALLRALYLAPDFVLAHFALGNLRRAQGRDRDAGRHFDNALEILRAQPADAPVAEADGLSAARLGDIVATLRSGLPHAAKKVA